MNTWRTFVVGAVVACASGSAWAGNVNIPKEGQFAFLFCWVGDERVLKSTDKIYVSGYRSIANTMTQPAGKAFDRMGALCYGTYANLTGRQMEFGVCEMTDQDGDKWWMEYHGGADGVGGTYDAAYGTGKYAGMTLKGEWVNDSWPGAFPDGIQGCNTNKGSYKLK